MHDQLDPGYNLAPLSPAAASRTPSSVAAVAARDTPSVVMIKVDDGAGTGSGFVISGGYIVTNNHVVTLDGEATGASLQIDLSNGSTVAGQLVGRDPYSDIAVIRAAGLAGLPALPLGDSDSVAVGDPVIAIGSPLGLADTVTSGIVSALDRPVQPGAGTGMAPEVYFDAIQTDAPINPGSSGGPLVNGRGEVIGVDAALDTLGGDPITGSQGGSIGLGFAIPVNQARRVIVQLIRTGYATHSVLGANLNGSYPGTGAQIATTGPRGQPPVNARGPAGKAGLRPGDVITRLGDQPVTTAYSLVDAIRSLPPGSRVRVSFVRQGASLRTSLVLGSARS
jgi:putative serine protease PepD